MQGRKRLAVDYTGEHRQTGRAFRQLPEPPEWMRENAAERFREVCGQLDSLGALAETDLGLVQRYACVYGRWLDAERALAESPDTIHFARLTNRAGQPASSVAVPALAQLNKCADQLAKMESALGLTPTERTRLPATRDPGPPDPMEELLARMEDDA